MLGKGIVWIFVSFVLAISGRKLQVADPTGVNYSPFHNDLYPATGGGSADQIPALLRQDFAQISRHFTMIKTFYSAYYGYSVANIAAEYNLKMYLGVFMTTESWQEEQINAAVKAVEEHPNLVLAILVGNENIQPVGPYSVDDVINLIKQIKDRLAAKGLNVPVGTAQRITEWVSNAPSIGRLADACDIIGANIYPYFSNGWDMNSPLTLLNNQWNQLVGKYDAQKLRLVETGFPTAGSPPAGLPNNVPSVQNGKAYYDAMMDWKAPSGGGENFLFSYYDRNPKAAGSMASSELHFGLCNYQGTPKFPLRPASGGPVIAPPAPIPDVQVPTPAMVMTPVPDVQVPTPAMVMTPVYDDQVPAPVASEPPSYSMLPVDSNPVYEAPVADTPEDPVYEQPSTDAPKYPVRCNFRFRA